jgi:4-amino-4-deoxy-L-arabinose transferase-like glycosyltransferase
MAVTSEEGIRRGMLYLLLAALCVLYFGLLGTIPLLDPDEGRYAEIPREMLASGDFVTPHLNGVVYLEKPPLFYWGTALGLAVFGENEVGARVFGAAASVLGVVLTFWMGVELAGPRTGLYAAAILATSFYYYVVGRLNTIDMTLGVLLVVAIFPAYLYLSGKRAARGYLYLAYAGAALAFLAKGLIGVVFPAAILLLWAILAKRAREVPRLLSWVGIAIFLALALPWVVLVQRANPDFFQFFFVREHLLRYTTKTHGRYQPFWYFLPIVPAGFLLWLPFVRKAYLAARRSAAVFFSREDRVFLLTWVGFIVLFFSASDSKLITYMTPVFPPLALLLGRGLDLWAAEEKGGAPFRVPLFVALALGAALLFAPLLATRLTREAVEGGGWLLTAGPALLALLGWGLVPLWMKRLGANRVVLLSAAFLALFWMSINPPAAALIGATRSGKSLAAEINARLRPGDIVAQNGVYIQTIPFYIKQRTIVVGDPDDLQFGMGRVPDRAEYFPDEAAFLRLWNSDRRVFCLFNRGEMDTIRERYPTHRLLSRSRRGILIVNH